MIWENCWILFDRWDFASIKQFHESDCSDGWFTGFPIQQVSSVRFLKLWLPIANSLISHFHRDEILDLGEFCIISKDAFLGYVQVRVMLKRLKSNTCKLHNKLVNATYWSIGSWQRFSKSLILGGLTKKDLDKMKVKEFNEDDLRLPNSKIFHKTPTVLTKDAPLGPDGCAYI